MASGAKSASKVMTAESVPEKTILVSPTPATSQSPVFPLVPVTSLASTKVIVTWFLAGPVLAVNVGAAVSTVTSISSVNSVPEERERRTI